jgi:hypothetical protein
MVLLSELMEATMVKLVLALIISLFSLHAVHASIATSFICQSDEDQMFSRRNSDSITYEMKGMMMFSPPSKNNSSAFSFFDGKGFWRAQNILENGNNFLVTLDIDESMKSRNEDHLDLVSIDFSLPANRTKTSLPTGGYTPAYEYLEFEFGTTIIGKNASGDVLYKTHFRCLGK